MSRLFLVTALCLSGHTAPAADGPTRGAEVPGQDAAPRSDDPAELVRRICAADPSLDVAARSSLAAALAGHGAGAFPAVFAALSGREGAPSVGPGGSLGGGARTLLLEAMGGWSATETLRALATELGREPNMTERLVALDVCAALGDADALEFLLEVLSGLSPAHLEHPRVAQPAEAAFSALLRGDRRTWTRLGSRAGNTAPHLLLPAARAAGEVGHAQGLDLLERMLELTPELDLAVVEALGKLRTWEPGLDRGRAAMLVGYGLGSRAPEARRQAAFALGRMRADAFAPELIQLLEDTEPRVAKSALWALRELSGLDWSADKARWEGWLEEEETWFAARWPLLGEVLHGTDSTAILDALRELGSHRIHRRELGEELTFALEHDDGAVVAAACAALSRLEDTGSVGALISCLGDRRRRVREAAARALRSLTGHDLPAREEAWRTLLDG